jgi:hypothetical protein
MSLSMFGIGASSCKKTMSFSNGNISFSQDTIIFDTVFTTIGSVTKNFRFRNENAKTIIVEEIALSGGTNSPFRLNVDGISGTQFENIEIEGGDSLYAFVEVTLDPNNGTLPLIIEDSIRFTTNGIDQYVQLVVWGQDAYFHYSYISEGILDINEGTWPNDKPHVIYGAAFVDSAKTLDIQAGTDIYLHKNAILYNYKGTLNINGTMAEPVTLQGDRLESAYDDVSGQYYGIYFQESQPSTINYAIIKNGTTGIHLFSEDPSNSGYTLSLRNTQILNCARYGLFIYSGAKVEAENCILAKHGTHSLLVLEGGDFNLNHCHLIGYGNGQEVGAAVGISNYFVDQINQVTNVGSINEGTITNSVIYGNLDNELAIDTLSDIAITLNFDFRNNLIRSTTVFTEPFYVDNIWNNEPLFYNIGDNDFHWYSTSPLDGGASFTFPTSSGLDIEGVVRSGPDIGAYEFL